MTPGDKATKTWSPVSEIKHYKKCRGKATKTWSPVLELKHYKTFEHKSIKILSFTKIKN